MCLNLEPRGQGKAGQGHDDRGKERRGNELTVENQSTSCAPLMPRCSGSQAQPGEVMLTKDGTCRRTFTGDGGAPGTRPVPYSGAARSSGGELSSRGPLGQRTVAARTAAVALAWLCTTRSLTGSDSPTVKLFHKESVKLSFSFFTHPNLMHESL